MRPSLREGCRGDRRSNPIYEIASSGFAIVAMTAIVLLLSGCEPTYKRDSIKTSVQELAKKEYNLDVQVAETGQTLGVRYSVEGLLAELFSGDPDVYKRINGLFTILIRVALSSDRSPDYLILEIADTENPGLKLLFTRSVEDVKKMMAEVLSYSQSQDRLLEEFVVGDKHIPFDPLETDLVRIMMMAMEAPTKRANTIFRVEDVSPAAFLARVIENTMRRQLREGKDLPESVIVREVTAGFSREKGDENQFRILLDLVATPSAPLNAVSLESKLLPFIAKEAARVFKSYRFDQVGAITVIEKNSGATIVVPRK